MAFEIRSVYQVVSCIESSAANKAQTTFSENDLSTVQESLRRLNFQFNKLIKSLPSLSPQSFKEILELYNHFHTDCLPNPSYNLATMFNKH